MTRVIVIGAGGQGQVAAEILMRMRDCGEPVDVVGFLDDNPALVGQSLLGIPVLGPMSALADLAPDAVLLGIGANARRAEVFAALKKSGARFFTAIHPTAVVSPTARIGVGVVICAGAIIGVSASVGDNTIINTRAIVEHHGVVAEHVHLASGACAGGEAVIEAGAFIGLGATVCSRCRVGAWSFIGAATFVFQDVPAQTKVVAVNALKPFRPVL